MNDTTSQLVSQYIPQRYIQLYHVTTRYRADLIAANGIDPSRSKGKRKVSWYVEYQMLAWAIAHVALRHGTPLNNIVVISCSPRRVYVQQTRWQHVYTCNMIHFPDPREFSSARKCLRQLLAGNPELPF